MMRMRPRYCFLHLVGMMFIVGACSTNTPANRSQSADIPNDQPSIQPSIPTQIVSQPAYPPSASSQDENLPAYPPSTIVRVPEVVLPSPTVTRIPTMVLPLDPALDFAFSLGFGACYTDKLDTFKHTYTKDLIDGSSVTIPLTLTVAEMTTIYQKMAAINFFAYPETYAYNAMGDPRFGIVTPADSYHFIVRNGGQTKTVEWTDNIVPPPTPDAERLQELSQLIVRIIQAHPEVQRLPERKAGCL